MKINEGGYEFLLDLKKYSDGYAIQYAIENKTPECWIAVLKRPGIPKDDVIDLAVSLRNKRVLLSVFKRGDLDAKKVVDTILYLYDEDAVWEEILGIESVITYLENLDHEAILSLYGTVKSELFWKEIKDIHPKLRKVKYV